jgi:hypothetical protein
MTPIVARLTHRAGCLDAELYQDLIEDLCEAAETIMALLEALEHIRAYGRSALTGAHCVAIAEAALAKARGQSI